jgi:hypothetical protein
LEGQNFRERTDQSPSIDFPVCEQNTNWTWRKWMVAWYGSKGIAIPIEHVWEANYRRFFQVTIPRALLVTGHRQKASPKKDHRALPADERAFEALTHDQKSLPVNISEGI